MRVADCPAHARKAHESLARRAGIDFERFMEAVAEWECFPVSVNGDPVGAVLRSGCHLHACIADKYGQWLSKRVLRILADTVEKHGLAETSVRSGNTIGEAFVKRLGFKESRRSGDVVFYEVRRGN